MQIKALVVGDDQTGNNLLKAILEYLGVQASEAGNGIEALELLSATDVALVISDAHMPAMNGYELISVIRQEKRLSHIKFILYTATCISAGNETKAYQMGVDRYLRKSGSIQEISATINELLKDREDTLLPS